MTASDMSASDPGRASELPAKQNTSADCRPMSHQNSGDHGYEMHPQQFVRLVGCHEVHATPAREPENAKLH